MRSFGIDSRLLIAAGALLFVAGTAVMLAAAGLFRRLGTNVRPSQPTTRSLANSTPRPLDAPVTSAHFSEGAFKVLPAEEPLTFCM